jgi:hypothetical protein
MKEPPVDTSAVPAPPGLVLVGRISKPEAIVSAVSNWTHLSLPNGSDLLRSITDDSIADIVDLTQPVDGAVSLGFSSHGVDALIAFSVAVKSFDDAKSKLATQHRLVPGPNGQLKVGGIRPGKSASQGRGENGHGRQEDDDDEDDDGCVLAHAAAGARLVCGEAPALVSLVPYLSRTVAREKWTSDIHVELHPDPVRAPLMAFRSSLPMAARSFFGVSSPAINDLLEASLGEVMDIVNDAQKISVDAEIGDSGVVGTARFDFEGTKSVFARMLTTSDHAGAPPAAFWHLPAETDTALFGRGSDPKLFDRPRELIANVLLEAADGTGMPEADRKAVKDLVADRMLALFTNGPGIYAKGYDASAVERAVKARNAIKPDDTARIAEARRILVEQVVGWHLYQLNEPIAKVGPILKDWSALWNRPSFMKWAGTRASKKKLAHMRIAPPPAGVTLPKDTVHLEISIPEDDAVADTVSAPAARPGQQTGKKAAAPAAPKRFPQKPTVVHVLAVPDGGATWLGFGMDAKLVAQKAAASLASAPDANTLGKVPGTEALREGKLNGGGFGTIRGLLVFTALDERERSPFGALASLASKGSAPVLFSARADAPSPTAKGGSSVGQIRISRAVIEDAVKVVMSTR